jgi:UDP-N-acetylmuramoylalanine-D-glutamate ligase
LAVRVKIIEKYGSSFPIYFHHPIHFHFHLHIEKYNQIKEKFFTNEIAVYPTINGSKSKIARRRSRQQKLPILPVANRYRSRAYSRWPKSFFDEKLSSLSYWDML